MSIIAFLSFDCTLLSYIFLWAFCGIPKIVHGIFNNSQTDRHRQKGASSKSRSYAVCSFKSILISILLYSLPCWDSLRNFKGKTCLAHLQGFFCAWLLAFCRHDHKLKPIKNAQYECLSFLLQKKGSWH